MQKRYIPPIEGARIVLRLLERDDLPLTLFWRNQKDIRKWFLNTAVIPAEGHYAWFERYQELDNDFIFIILAKNMNFSPVGQISLYDIDWDAKTAEFGRLLIGEPFAAGKGFAKDAARLLVAYGFDSLGLREIILEVKDDNEPAKAVYRDVGFTETSRKDNLVIMTILKD